MKFLEEAGLARLGSYINGHDCSGNKVVYGRLEAYSCKDTKSDKALRKEIDRRADETIAQVEALVEREAPPPELRRELSNTSIGDLHDPSTRKLLLQLISLLNLSFPEREFSNLDADDFEPVSLPAFVASVEDRLQQLNTQPDAGLSGSFFKELWTAVDQVLQLAECVVYTFRNEVADDFAEEATLWHFAYFVCSKPLQRILLFTCEGRSKFSPVPPAYSGTVPDDKSVGSSRPGASPARSGFGSISQSPSIGSVTGIAAAGGPAAGGGGSGGGGSGVRRLLPQAARRALERSAQQGPVAVPVAAGSAGSMVAISPTGAAVLGLPSSQEVARGSPARLEAAHQADLARPVAKRTSGLRVAAAVEPATGLKRGQRPKPVLQSPSKRGKQQE